MIGSNWQMLHGSCQPLTLHYLCCTWRRLLARCGCWLSKMSTLRTGRHSEHAPSRQAQKCADSCCVGRHLRTDRGQHVSSAALLRWPLQCCHVMPLGSRPCMCISISPARCSCESVDRAMSVAPFEHTHVNTVASHGVAAACAAATADVAPQPAAVGAAAMSEGPQLRAVLTGCCYVHTAPSAVAAGGPVQ